MIGYADYTPEEGSVLYHYCSADTLLAILRHKTLRFGDISQMNDSLEMEWGLRALGEVVTSRRNIPDAVRECVARAVVEVGDEVVTLASCLSKKGDVLSQWRAYADDGAGFAVGLDPWAFDALSVNLLEVCYDVGEQQRKLDAVIDLLIERFDSIPDRDEFKASIDGGGERIAEVALVQAQFHALRVMATYAVCDVVALKNPAFSEESEVRVVQLAHMDQKHGSAIRLINNEDDDWPDDRRPSIGFNMRRGVPVCFADMPVPSACLCEIVIGPRNTSSDHAIARFLATMGFAHVRIRRSVASYR